MHIPYKLQAIELRGSLIEIEQYSRTIGLRVLTFVPCTLQPKRDMEQEPLKIKQARN